ncbi:ATP-dependent helicase HrpB [Paenibacillus sp. P96]|uniref:ATP-dependent helicase HrpB n=1 Tax=Paenibacillus zeirhizosphaerae TaxID=2987519 RepID=A0ABT9FRU6_9BACL|nr:ATP-dependent helicase HrpB [Paenibacillus sp. P96]MDP4097420.1 ATP-dependent helicase HrpB [Paenibacillus sp. P96]
MLKKELPIYQILSELKDTFRNQSSAVLVAEPGAGKTTVVPLALLEEPWLAGRKIIMLEPRRLAARSAAARMAEALGEKVGQTVGYRVHMDTKIGPSTRIEVVTEGILTRMLQGDPALEEAGAVIFDEFHERSLHADLGLALVLQTQSLLRPELRLLVMSATLEAAPVRHLLGGAPLLESSGRTYPVETVYVPKPKAAPLESFVAEQVVRLLSRHEGDVLVFLPGAREIHRTEAEIMTRGLPSGAYVRKLYGALSLKDQDQAVHPSPAGQRKIVLSTSIAESSLTIEGITMVVDSGLRREPVFSPRTGMNRLETVKVSKAAADQRRGRAGRLGPGTCYRLWSMEEHGGLAEAGRPEILSADLAPLVLETALWGAEDASELAWIDPPPGPALRQASELLERLECLREGKITEHGKRVASLAAHPRLGHMLLKSAELGYAGQGSCLAALLQERDPFKYGADLRPRLEKVWDNLAGGTRKLDSKAPVDGELLGRITQNSRHLLAGLQPVIGGRDRGSASCGLLLSFAYPDRIGRSRGEGRYLLSSGRGVRLAGEELLSRSDYLVAASVEDAGADGTIRLAAPVEEQELTEHQPGLISEQAAVYWDSAAGAVRARKMVRLGAIVMKELPYERPPQDQMAEAWMAGLRDRGLELLTWTKSARQLQKRIVFMHRKLNDWPAAADEDLLANLEDWLLPYAQGIRSLSDLKKLQVESLLLGMLSWEQRQELDREAPTHIRVPSGSNIPVDYSNPDAPVLSVRLQELFGMSATPRLGRGRVPVVLHLLSPAQRPVQVTSDLASFWKEAYFEVKKDLKGRYPKHYWPDDPLQAAPTSRVRPRK